MEESKAGPVTGSKEAKLEAIQKEIEKLIEQRERLKADAVSEEK